jgi:hypothetical protein
MKACQRLNSLSWHCPAELAGRCFFYLYTAALKLDEIVSAAMCSQRKETMIGAGLRANRHIRTMTHGGNNEQPQREIGPASNLGGFGEMFKTPANRTQEALAANQVTARHQSSGQRPRLRLVTKS